MRGLSVFAMAETIVSFLISINSYSVLITNIVPTLYQWITFLLLWMLICYLFCKGLRPLFMFPHPFPAGQTFSASLDIGLPVLYGFVTPLYKFVHPFLAGQTLLW